MFFEIKGLTKQFGGLGAVTLFDMSIERERSWASSVPTVRESRRSSI